MKLCPLCKETLSSDCFYKKSKRKDGLSYSCKTCEKKQVVAWRKMHPEQVKQYKKAWNRTQKGRAYISAYNKRYHEKYGDRKKRLRFDVFARDSFRCVYCGRAAPDVLLQVDHRIPKSRGGPNSFDNYVTACIDCNQGKGDVLLTSMDAQAKREQSSDN
jgi:5-methylcytosine-specific restriction endonuclease McrA